MPTIPGRASVWLGATLALLLVAGTAIAAGYHDLRPLRDTAPADRPPRAAANDGDKESQATPVPPAKPAKRALPAPSPPLGKPASKATPSAPAGSATPAVADGPRVLRVGPTRDYRKPSEAFAAVRPGDTIEIDAGEYVNDAACIRNLRNVTIRGVGGYAHMRAEPAPGQKFPVQCNSGYSRVQAGDGRATWGFLNHSNVVLEKLEFSGARSGSGNSAGVRIGAGTGEFIVRDVLFHHNQNGLITDPAPELSLLIERSQFDQNAGNGYIHNMYISKIKRFTLRESYSRRAHGGQLVKTRAFENYILYNRFTDESPVNSNYQLELDGLGTAYVIGNVLRKRNGSTNCCTLFHMNVDKGREHDLYVINNTFVYESNPGRSGRRFIRIHDPHDLPVRATVLNNIFVGEDNVDPVYTNTDKVQVVMRANLRLPLGTDAFVDMANNDFRLKSSAIAINAGVDPGTANGVSLVPTLQYRHVASAVPRAIEGPLVDAGAYEFAGTPDRLYPPPIVHISAAHTLTDMSSQLTWSSNGEACVATGAWSGDRPTAGEANSGPIREPAVFGLRCTGPGGTASDEVTVTPPPTASLAIGAAFAPVPVNGKAVVHWSAAHATGCTGVEGISGTQPLEGGIVTPALTRPTRFAVACTGLAGERVERSVVVDVAGTVPPLPAGLEARFHLRGLKDEVPLGVRDGGLVTPAVGPKGVVRQRGRGTGGFEPDGGVWFSYGGGAGQQNKDTAYFEFALPGEVATALFNEAAGAISARVTPRFDYDARGRSFPTGNRGHQFEQIVSVVAGGVDAASFAFETWGGKFHVYMQPPGGEKQRYIMAKPVGAALLARGKPLDIRMVWDGGRVYLFLDGALAYNEAYKRKPVDWSDTTMTVGADLSPRWGGGFSVMHDLLQDVVISAGAAGG